ncbi:MULTISPECIES: glycosyltransferase family 4 protein [Nostocales]|uniref:Glycosyltransferase n=3 Tax=Nostocales TaxID=1161 RepID=A0A0C1MX79_9CYAN|nr:glycosyltransferase family 4 protein [Tolypothrix bouteillei]KAF3889673.1 glycosyltransferase family 4 protein [Tolypothrix bouteillei VB521301]
MKLKIAIVVHGRFHAFDLARELINQGHDVTLYTNYPKRIVEKFGISQKCVMSFLLHGLLSRVIYKVHNAIGTPDFEACIHSNFSRWAAHKIVQRDYDVVHVFSGVAEEIFQALSHKRVLKTLVRGSAHIRTQFNLLSEEEKRVGTKINKPSNWMIDREEREYQLADIIICLSTFAKQSFLEQNVEADKLKVLPLGAQLEKFRPSEQVIEARYQRILSGKCLNVLMVSNFSFQKGIYDLVNIACNTNYFISLKFIGFITNEAINFKKNISNSIQFISKQAQFDLPMFYADADVFIFPTIQDGYAMVLAQAQASGLPILTTTNCSSLDIIVEGQTGWVLPIRSPERFIERLKWCHEHRQELAQMVRSIYDGFKPRDWTEVAADFASIHTNLLGHSRK